MTVLAHIVLDGGFAPEPAATKAFAYILNSDRATAQAFVAGVLGEMNIDDFDPGFVGSEVAYGEGPRPDLVIHDAEKLRLIVEFKFWADLTDNQPVAYLDLLPEDEQSALLFVVPEQRVAPVWRDVKARCEDAGIELEGGPNDQPMTWAQVCPPDGNRVLAITSWAHIFELLAPPGVDENFDTISNIHQLQGLTEQATRRLMVSTALIIWWYGPYRGIEEFRENAMVGAQLYMAIPEPGHGPPHIGANAVDVPDPDAAFLELAANGCALYVGQISPTPAGPRGMLEAAAERAASTLRYVLQHPAADGPPAGYVSLFSSFYEGELNEAINDYPCTAPPSGFPIVIAFNPSPEPVDDSNWTVVRVPRFA